MKGRLAILWRRMGPYHLARLRGATARFGRADWMVRGIEITPTDRTYGWDAVESTPAADYGTLFPGRSYEELEAGVGARALLAELDRTRPDAVAISGWAAPEALAALSWCRRHGRGAVLMSESKRDDAARHWWREWIKARRVRRFGAALVGGAPHRDYVVRLGLPAERVFLGYDVVDNDFFATESERYRRDGAAWRSRLGLPERYFLSVSRFLEVKNLECLLDAYRLYRERAGDRPAWGLVMCGGGPLESALRRRVADLDSVVWPGFRQVAELPALYGLASAFILPSLREPWGLVVNEAMACGLPVIVSHTAGCRHELVRENENGFLFDPEDRDELAAAMLRIAGMDEDERARMGRRSTGIVADWSPARFGEMLWQAVKAATGR